MNLSLLLKKFMQTLRHGGIPAVTRSVRTLLMQTGQDAFDARHGTDTASTVPLWRCEIDCTNASLGTRYEYTPEDELEAAVRFLCEDLGQFTFIDLGCGKGRTLLVASKLGFEEIVGVEFAKELGQIARSNLAKMQVRNATVIHADAAEYKFPHRNIVIYLFNPFQEPVMQKVISNLQKSSCEKLYVIYRVPECAPLLDSSGFLRRLGRPSVASSIVVWAGSHQPTQFDSLRMKSLPALFLGGIPCHL